jgi:hypothetical protein
LKRSVVLTFAAVIASLPLLLQCQTDQTFDGPPSVMRICANNSCDILTWTDDHYEGRADGATTITARFWITNWGADLVLFTGKTAKAVDGIFPLEETFTGKISPGGGSIINCQLYIRIGYSGWRRQALIYTVTWDKRLSNEAKVSDISVYRTARRSATHPNILLPPGASEEFASYPDYMRGILQHDNPLSPARAKLPCNTTVEVSAVEALEIGKFAYRVADFSRGHCWVKRSADMGNVRAKVLLGASALMGWGTPKDGDAAFHYFVGADGHQDVWNVYFLEKCNEEGIGTPVNKQKAAQLDAWLMMRSGGQNLFLAIGADDIEKVKIYKRGLLLMNPPMKSGATICDSTPSRMSPAPPSCHTDKVVDQEELDEELSAIDECTPESTSDLCTPGP